MAAGARRAGGLALGCPWPGVGTTALSGAVCSEEGSRAVRGDTVNQQ